ncbi:hypothetical protein M2244_000745 [Rhodoferax antarcticus]|nr:hypothetical protein [Rhodoferax antarcticus]
MRILIIATSAPAGAPLIHAGLAHLWLVTLHPFDDGNGRISRAVGELVLGLPAARRAGRDGLLAGVLIEAQFLWQRWAGTPMNARQTLALNCVLDGIEG